MEDSRSSAVARRKAPTWGGAHSLSGARWGRGFSTSLAGLKGMSRLRTASSRALPNAFWQWRTEMAASGPGSPPAILGFLPVRASSPKNRSSIITSTLARGTAPSCSFTLLSQAP